LDSNRPVTPGNNPIPETPRTPADPASPTEPAQPVPPVQKPAEWAENYVNQAISLGLIPTYLQNNYTDNITRAEFSSVLAQVLSRKDLAAYKAFVKPSVLPFTDTDNTDIIWLNSKGIVGGVGEGAFNPTGRITRQEAAVMLKRAAVAYGVSDTGIATGFADQGEIADWAVDALGFVVDKGIMSGTGENRFSPQGMYTREQAFVTLMRLNNSITMINTINSTN
jgi:hypothetical protein